MALKKEWYITFHTAETVIIVFRKKIFQMSGKGVVPIYQKCIDITYAEDREKWEEMLAYSKSLKIPEDQCDFLPEDFDKREY